MEYSGEMGKSFPPFKIYWRTRTKSLAEAINSFIKQYVNSKNEISDFINFISNFEKKSIYDNFKVQKEILKQYESHSIINELKSQISETIFDRHFNEFTLSHK